jgi:GNAT superfamily N-acetyltransferase
MAERDLRVRPVAPGDLEPLRAVLNAIIAAGGTTAYEEPFSAAAMGAYLFHDPSLAQVFVVLDAEGRPAGFQRLATDPGLPAGWLAIGTFTRRDPLLPGAGRALFAASRDWAAAAGVVAIDATIRADNAGGLAFYAAMGFEDYHVTPGVPLRDGRPVDRISKAYRI